MSDNYFYEVLQAVRELSADELADGALHGYSYFCGTRAALWEVSPGQMRQELIAAMRSIGYDHDNAIRQVTKGLYDGLAVINEEL